jgi:parallel beta-helix repeat protein
MKTVSGIILSLLLIGVLTLAFDIQQVKASGTIYIRADGSVEPSTANITSVDNVTYTFTNNINDYIVVQRNNIVVDGAGYTLRGTGSGTGIDLSYRNNLTLKNVEVTNFNHGIFLEYSSNNTVTVNTASDNTFGIVLGYSSNNTISGNNLSSNNNHGIVLSYSSNNTVTVNTASDNNHGIVLSYSSNNTISGNNLSSNRIVGIWLHYSSNNTVSVNTASSNDDNGILLISSGNNTLTGNTASNNDCGIGLLHSSNNTISGNNVSSNNYYGLSLVSSSNNTISGNNVSSNNDCGIDLYWSSNNVLFHNNLIGNTPQASVTTGYVNTWDNGYPSGGNYWSDHNPPDVYSGPYQNVTGSDGIGDTPYVIDADNQDNYPLMGPFTEFSVYLEDVTYHVDVVSNSTLSDFNFNQPDKLINFNVTGPDDTLGFCRVTIPKILLGGPYTVLVDNLSPTTLTETSNGIHTFLCFTYSHTTKNVKIIGTRVGPTVGDINSDGIVDINDIVIAALAFGSYPGHPRWNPIADIKQDGIIDIIDLVIIGVNFGKRL